jgi:hypothetical protein
MQTIRRFKEDDDELLELYRQAQKDVNEHLKTTAQRKKAA